MAGKVKAIPDGYGTVTPYLVLKGAAEGIEFYKRAFGAEEIYRMPGPDGKVMHAEVRIGTSIVMLGDEAPEMGAISPSTLGGAGASLLLYVEDVDASFARATGAGAKAQMPPTDMFWGDRYGKVQDPFGHVWSIATHKEDVSPEKMKERMAKECA